MIETRNRPGLQFEPLSQSGLPCNVGVKHLQGNGPSQPNVAALVDLPHASDSEQRLHLVWAKSSTGGK